MRKQLHSAPLYSIDEVGVIINEKTKKTRKCTVNRDGYLRCRLYILGKYKFCQVHRLIAETFIPNPNNHPCINHIDGNKLNNQINNLEWCDYSYNINAAYTNKLINPKVRIDKSTKEKVISMYFDKGMSQKTIIQELDLSHVTIWRIIKKYKNAI